jgi:UDP-N-acetylmuramoyl-L-alanyl-D-glutamate--2,6-diaminopimelate ligase
MARMSDLYFGRPTAGLQVVGVTGTNGKTTTTYMLEAAAAASGGTVGVIGTVETRLAGKRLAKAVNTTPISLELNRTLAQMRDGGASAVMMEVSSHALALKRAETVDFDAAVFLNLTRDHLDFHKTVDEYFEAKGRLFDLLARVDNIKKLKVAALNADDPRSHHLKRRAVGCDVVEFGLGEGAKDLRARVLSADLNGTRIEWTWRGKRLEGAIRMPGLYNVSNATAAAAALLGLGHAPQNVLHGLAMLRAVPGRLEAVEEGQDFHVFVDYAHTDSALETVLKLLHSLPHKNIITVVGCGGDRDKTKRGPMGVAACRGSDHAVFTSDNPRSEDPAAILADIEAGVRAAGLKNHTMVPDRGEAIAAAIARARTGDVVLIAGKGHEDYQILRDRTVPFDDREAARSALRSLKK